MKKLLLLQICFLSSVFFLTNGCTSMTPQQQVAWQNSWQMFNENYQRELDRQAYGRQPTIVLPQRNQNYWQEQLAQQQWSKNWSEQFKIKPMPIPEAAHFKNYMPR